MIKAKPWPFLTLLVMLSSLVVTLFLIQIPQRYLTEALGEPASINVDATSDLGPIWPVWQALAQGGEENANMLAGIEPVVKTLKPQFIRLDHIYDYYDTVKKENGRLVFNWTKLDAAVDSIIKSGAKPFFALSYMPPSVAENGDITGRPVDWRDWQAMVRATVEHFSGFTQRNLADVYYEVWNEPDLFGGWKIGGSKNYLDLYAYAVRGAQSAGNVNRFKIGGPATTGLYKNWVTGLVGFAEKNQLPLDFISWHHYSKNPEDFAKDIQSLDEWLTAYPRGPMLLRLVTEWGSDPENTPIHDSGFDAAHLVSVTRQILQGVNFAFVFEIKDGKSPGGEEYWGRWGLLTHTLKKKPKFEAINNLNQMTGTRLRLTGEGSWVTGFAVRNDLTVKILLVNYDPYGRHFETVPVSLFNLAGGNYQWEEKRSASGPVALTETVANGLFARQVYLRPNETVLITLTRLL